MAVVGTAEIIITPILKGFAGVGAAARAELGAVGAAAGGAAGQLGAVEKGTQNAAKGLGATERAAAGATGGLRNAERGAVNFGSSITSMGSKVTGAALAVTKLGSFVGVAGLAYAFFKGASDANKFNAEMARLTTQAGVSEDQMAGLSSGVLDLAGKIGSDPDSLAESLFHVESNFSSMGISSQRALELVETAAKGARVGNADLVDVTNALTAAVAANIPGVENLDEAMGYLNATVGSGDMNMQNLADAMGTGAVAVVKGYGLSIKDVGAALAVFGDNNIRGAVAGTQLRMTVQSLAVPAKGGADALQRLGLAQDTLAKDMQKGGLNAAITDLHQRLQAAGITAQQQGQILTEAFGKKAGTGLNILVDQFDRLESKYPELEEGATRFGDAWAGTQKTTKQQIAELKGSFDSLLIKIGEASQPLQGKLAGIGAAALSRISGGIDAVRAANQQRSAAGDGGSGGDTSGQSAGLGKLATLLNDVQRIGSSTKRIIDSFGPGLEKMGKAAGAAAGIGIHALADILGKLSDHTTLVRTAAYELVVVFGIWKGVALATAAATKIMAAAEALLNAVMDANPITLIVIAIAALAVGVYEAYQHCEPFRKAVQAIGRALEDAGKWVVKTAKSFGQDLADAFGKVEGATKSVGRFFERLYNDVKHWFDVAKDFVKKWWPLFAIAVTGGAAAIPILIATHWRQIVDFTKRAFNDVKDFVVRIFKDVYNAVSSVVSAVLDFVGRHWRLLLVIVGGPIGLIIVLLVNAKDRIVRGFQVMWEAVSGFAQRIWRDVSGFFSKLWSDVTGFASRIWKDVSGFFSKFWSDVSGFASRIWHDVAGFFTSLWHDVSGIASRLWHDVSGFFSNLWHDVSGFASNLWHDVAGFFTNLWRDVTGLATRIWHEVSTPFTNLWTDAKTIASNLWKDVTGWFDRVKTDITNSVKTAVGWVKGAWDQLKDIFKTPINFLINTVYNNGIRPVWNAFAGIVHEGTLDRVNGLAAGGPITGGVAGRDSVPAMLMPGEHVWTAAEVAAAGGQQAMFALRRLFGGGGQSAGFGMKDGGTAGRVLGAITNAVTHPLDTLESLGSGTLTVLGQAVQWVRGGLAKAAETALAPVRAAIHATLGTGHDWKGTTGQVALRPFEAIINLLRGQDKKDQTDAASSGGAPVAAAPKGEIQAYAMQLLTQRGWAGQWNAFNALVMGESGWNPAARNPSSGAYGIPQALPASKLDAYGNRNDYRVQLRWMLDYIAGRADYRTPAGAYSKWLSRSPHWYDQGGPLKPGLTLAANGTGKDEWIVPKSAVSVAGRGVTFAKGAITQTIDARGASDPAEFERIVQRANANLIATLDQMLQQGEGAF